MDRKAKLDDLPYCAKKYALCQNNGADLALGAFFTGSPLSQGVSIKTSQSI